VQQDQRISKVSIGMWETALISPTAGAARGHNPGRVALRGKIGKPFKGF
jgi:hypothetical protein